ncbi:MAG: class I tRNA ligase family protein [Rhodoplanes sp.]
MNETVKKHARDYSKTLFLPKTDFPMRAGLPQREPGILARWERLGLYRRLREAAHGRDRFILHDGPPYANGHIHIGTALNKVLKDLVTRSQQMLGFDSNYVPGWDCHGLPIEWKIEEENYRAKGKAKPDLSNPAAMIAFRQECRAYAEHWLNVQREEFKRLGVVGDWDHPYTTMSFPAEAQIARELMKFAAGGTLYRGSKPVMWSVVEQTALAEAEVEYEDYVSDTVWVKFPVLKANSPYETASVVIWTTTPWTIPGNRAICYSNKKEVTYGLYEVVATQEGSRVKPNERLILSDALAPAVKDSAKIDDWKRVVSVTPQWIERCAHPLREWIKENADPNSNRHYDFDVPLFEGDHVTNDVGTGFVHTAPSHGLDDYYVWLVNMTINPPAGISSSIPYPVDADGKFTKDAPGFEGLRVITETGEKGEANDAVIKALVDAGMLVARGKLRHQYPHSWRSKKPVIFRNTPQWFIAMDKDIADVPAAAASSPLPGGERPRAERAGEGAPTSPASPDAPHPTPSASTAPQRGEVRRDAAAGKGDSGLAPAGAPRNDIVSKAAKPGDTLRARALAAIKATRWVPPQGENRITGMIENRPDWVISRQRAWGVPITLFVRERAGDLEVLEDARVNQRIADAFEAEGADAWYAEGARERFLSGLVEDPAEWEKIDDILDVWFDSGSTHAFVLEDPKNFPAFAGLRRKIDGGRDTILYLEGSDQHRGWFHSSLLESCGTRGRAPFDAVVTHGFTLDEHGRKMSKSLGNTIAPQDVIREHGADILRLWVASCDYWDDQRIGPEILKTTVDTYRKLRNTIRWMLGNLAHFHEQDRVRPERMPSLDRYMLHRLAELDALVRDAYAGFDYKRIFAALNQFMTVDLSAFYFDIRKDALYCDPISSLTRKSCLTALDHLFRCTVTWLAPMLCFTAEEAWLARYPSEDGSVHLELFPEVPAAWRNDHLADQWRKVRTVRRVVTGALELERAAKRIGSSLEADPFVYISNEELFDAMVDMDLAEICITSAGTLIEGEGPVEAFRLPDVPGVAVVPQLAQGTKCARSWKISLHVGDDPKYLDVSPRDAQALRELDALYPPAE